jgi:antitoxin component YwqK of YwqJK toxin-antitoxin module
MDSLWRETTNANYKYYRIVKDYNLVKDSYRILDYYKNGVLQMEGMSKTKDDNSKIGAFNWYYQNGNKKSTTNYIDGRQLGKCYEWYENGNNKLEGKYIENSKTKFSELKIDQFWNTKNIQTVVDGNGEYEEINEEYNSFGKIKNGYKDGEWKGNNISLKYTYTEIYENEKFVSGISIDANKAVYEYKAVEIQPEFKGGMHSFYKHIQTNFRTPEKPYNLKGKILIQFTINIDGSVIDPKIIKSLGYGTDEEAIRLVNSFNKKWISAEKRGIKVKCTYVLPIVIQTAE